MHGHVHASCDMRYVYSELNVVYEVPDGGGTVILRFYAGGLQVAERARFMDGNSFPWPQWGLGPLNTTQWIRVIDAYFDSTSGRSMFYLDGGTRGILITNSGSVQGTFPAQLYIGDTTYYEQSMRCFITDLRIDSGRPP